MMNMRESCILGMVSNLYHLISASILARYSLTNSSIDQPADTMKSDTKLKPDQKPIMETASPANK